MYVSRKLHLHEKLIEELLSEALRETQSSNSFLQQQRTSVLQGGVREFIQKSPLLQCNAPYANPSKLGIAGACWFRVATRELRAAEVGASNLAVNPLNK